MGKEADDVGTGHTAPGNFLLPRLSMSPVHWLMEACQGSYTIMMYLALIALDTAFFSVAVYISVLLYL